MAGREGVRESAQLETTANCSFSLLSRADQSSNELTLENHLPIRVYHVGASGGFTSGIFGKGLPSYEAHARMENHYPIVVGIVEIYSSLPLLVMKKSSRSRRHTSRWRILAATSTPR